MKKNNSKILITILIIMILIILGMLIVNTMFSGKRRNAKRKNGGKKFNGYSSSETQNWVNMAPHFPPTYKGDKQPDLDKNQDIDTQMIRRAIKLASHNPTQAGRGEKPDGGLFGAVLYKNGKILGEGWNTVLKEGDPTRHGEMNAIRQAVHNNGYSLEDLEGATLYTSGEPCPMCYSAIAWANVKEIIYASSYDTADKYGGFKDDKIKNSFKVPIKKRPWPGKQMEEDHALLWWKYYNKVIYKNGTGDSY